DPTVVRKLTREAVENMGYLAQRCTYEFKKLPPALPIMAGTSKDDEWAKLKELCIAGFKRRLQQPVLAYQPDKAQLPAYLERLRYELDVLKSMGFAGYFLLVSEIVNWAKDHDIIVGPGRGSVGGSLVAYLIG